MLANYCQGTFLPIVRQVKTASQVSRNRSIAGGVLALAAVLGACARQPDTASKPLSPPTEERILNVYNWAGYIGKDTIAEFERRTGIHVNYDVYDSENTLEARVLAGGSDYDVVVASTEFFGREIKVNAYQPLDRAQLNNWGNLDPHVLAIVARSDPGNRYAVPYLHAVTGFAYNTSMIKARMPDAPLDSLDMLLKPEVVSRFADCGVNFFDSPSSVLPLALNYLHRDRGSTRPEDFKAVEKLVLSVRPYIRNFDSVDFMTDLLNQELCITMSWSSDFALARVRAEAAGKAFNIAFTVPKEGANISYDALLIPAAAPHPQAAHRFLNFMMEPKVIADITNELYYGNNNRAAAPYVDPQILHDPTIYPTAELEKRLFESSELNPVAERSRTRAWTRIKTGL